MTKDEANVLLKFHLPCVITGGYNTEPMRNKEYRITALTESYQPWSRTYIYSAALENDRKAVYQIEISNLEPSSGYDGFVTAKIKEAKKQNLKELLIPLLNNLKTRKEIYSFIGKLLDEIKAERKGAA